MLAMLKDGYPARLSECYETSFDHILVQFLAAWESVRMALV